jgi:hypothetical protein
MERVIDADAQTEVARHEVPPHWTLVLQWELVSHYQPELFAEVLLEELPELLQAPDRNSLGSYFSNQVRGVRDQPAFRQAVQELELVDYWQLYGWPEVCRPVGAHGFECE